MLDISKPEASDRLPSYKNFFGPQEIVHRVVFQRGSYMECVYCGKFADTREHAPSKTFLKEPYPADLPVVPACRECNNSYSDDELYSSTFIELYKNYYYQKNYPLDERTAKHIFTERAAIEAMHTFGEAVACNKVSYDYRIGRILNKLAVCHMVYELSEGYYCDRWNGVPEYTSYRFLPNMTEQEIRTWEEPLLFNDKIIPMVGSREYSNIFIIEPTLSPYRVESGKKSDQVDSSNQNITMPFVILSWKEVQDNCYRYTCWIDREFVYVRIVIAEFLFAELAFKNS